VQSPLTPLQNVRLRVRFPALGQDSEDIYGKVVAASGKDGVAARIGLTSVNAADQQIFDELLRGQPVPA